MIFYHFTAKRFVPSILKEGLTRGVMLKSWVGDKVEFIPHRQWITTKKEFDQGWSVGTGRLPYKRNEVRMTVDIPLEFMVNCKPWTQMRFLVPEVAKDLENDERADPENWHIYQGNINPNWIVEVVENEALK